MQLSSRAACVVIIGLGLVACAPAQTAGPSNVPVAPADAARWTIAAHQVDCVGVGPMKCLRYRDRPGGPWLNFYDQIEGFNFQPGVEVDLLVRFITVERPPADGSSRRVVAVRELDRRPVAVSASLPAALTATPWQVSALPGRPLNSDRLTLSFDETGRVSGHAGVNRYSAAVSGDAAQLRVSQAVVTRLSLIHI